MASFATVAFAAFLPVSIAGIQISWWVAALAVAGLVATGERPRFTALAPPLLLHALTVALSLGFAAWPGRGQESWNLWRLLAIPVLTFALSRDRATTRGALLALLGVSLLVAPYGVLQYFTGVDWLRVTDKTVRYAAAFAEGRYRPVGAFNGYHTFAFVYTSVGLVAAAAAVSFRGRARPWLWAAAGLLVGASLLSQVRAAWMAGAAGLLTIGWLHSRRAVLRATLAIVVVGVLAAAVVPSLRAKAVATADLTYGNNQDRIFMWSRALEMVSDHPVTGIGHGSWTEATTWYFDRWDARQPVRCHAHQNFLHFWATTGPFGLMAFVWLLLAHLRQSARAFRRSRGVDPLASTLALAGTAVVAGFIAFALTQDPYFDGEVFYAFALALAFGATADRWTRRDTPRTRRTSALAGWLVPTAAGILGAAVARPAVEAGEVWAAALLVGPMAVALGLAALSRRVSARRFFRDDYALALGLSALLVLGLPPIILRVLAPAADLDHTATASGALVAAIGFATAAAVRALFVLRPRRGAAIAAASALLFVGGLLGLAPRGGASGPPIPTDRDEDGIPDARDGCMRYDPSQTDTDGDGVGDACEPIQDVVATPEGLIAVTANGGLLRLALPAPSAPEGEGPPDGRGVPLRTFSPENDWAAVARGRFGAGDAPRLALASYWAQEVRLVDAGGRTVARRAEDGTRWTGLTRHAAGSGDWLVGVGHGRPSVVAWSGPGLTPRAALDADARYDAVASLDLDGDGREEIVAARGGTDGPWALDVLSIEGGALTVRHSLSLGYPVSSLLVADAVDGVRFFAIGRWGRIEAFVATPTGVPEAAGFTVVEGGLRWAVPGEDDLIAYRRKDPGYLRTPYPSVDATRARH